MLGVFAGQIKGAFKPSKETAPDNKARKALGDDYLKLVEWKRDIEGQTRPISMDPHVSTNDRRAGLPANVTPFTDQTPIAQNTDLGLGPESAIEPARPEELKRDQRRAFDIITSHLNKRMKGENPPQLLMQIQGEGGTGKSKIIQTVTQYFAQHGVKCMLQKMAYTGIAASLIEGKTTHTAASIGTQRTNTMSDRKRAEMEAIWKPIEYIIIDEVSMIEKQFFAKMSRNIAFAKNAVSTDEPFGGVNVIICGDFHQFPPVIGQAKSALFTPNTQTFSQTEIAEDEATSRTHRKGKQTSEQRTTHQHLMSYVGRMIYEKFQIVVLLTEQMRVNDPVWTAFLRRLRHGRLAEPDMSMLDSLVLTNILCPRTDFATEPWKDACLVTPRHAVREAWNNAATERMCIETGAVMFIIQAEDTVGKREVNRFERLEIAQQPSDQRRQIPPAEIILAIGMKVGHINSLS